MRIAYFDCFSGASGDMILGALVDAGVDPQRLKQELSRLNLAGFDLLTEKSSRCGLACSQVRIRILEDDPPHRNLEDIRKIFQSSNLSASVAQQSWNIFVRLAEAEAKVHGTSIEHIHFHEVGALDAIIDIVGSVIGLHLMGIERIWCSPLNTGSGTVRCQHGLLPVPAPATAELIRGKPVYSSHSRAELLTPTGAAILTTLAEQFGNMPEMLLDAIGYGAGTMERDTPNLLRLLVGESFETRSIMDTDEVVVLETHIDDMNPQIFDLVLDKAFEHGALDMWLSPIQMKKNRPGWQIGVICRPGSDAAIAELLLTETSTIGIRRRTESRWKASRRTMAIDTPFGKIRMKIAEIRNRIVNISPEYDDCREAAIRSGVPLKTVMEAARHRFHLTSESISVKDKLK